MKKRKIVFFFIIFIITLILELTVFNINSYRVLTSKNKITFLKDSFQYIQNNDNCTFVQINNIDTEIKTVHIQINNIENIEYKFLYSDETTASFRETPTKMYVEKLENSKYIPTYLSGKSNKIAIEIYGENIDLKSINVNERIPMNFSFVRVLILFSLFSFIFCLRNFEIFNIPFSPKYLKQEFILLSILGVFVFIIFYINVNSLKKEFDFYSYNFVKALSNRQVYLEDIPSDKLLNIKNPYDSIQRGEEGIIRGEDYLWDTAYYNGKAYVYFGILPVLILFLPYYLITKDFLISAIRSIIFFDFICYINKGISRNCF